MPAIFRTILVPVDFSINTQVAIKKCLEIAEPEGTAIHLFHVHTSLSTWWGNVRQILSGRKLLKKTDYSISLKKLQEWKSLVEDNNSNISVEIDSVETMTVENAIVEKAMRLVPDIVVIGKNRNHARFSFLNTVSPHRIAKATGFPVLTVRPGSIYNKVKSVVVPIGSFVPEKKMELILALRKKYRLSIHLVTIMSGKQNANDFSAHALLNSYRFLRDVANCPLDHEILHGSNIARSSLKFAQQIKADMLVVDSDKETIITSFPGKYISDELTPNSRLQILTV
jgi:nucleotide-binding universal stress UspA family protein